MDLRIEKTYRALLTAFTKLLEEHPYEDVTVAMLCDEAMIRRTTFYKHFADKAEFFSFFADNLRIGLLKEGEEKAQGVGDPERSRMRDGAPDGLKPVDVEGLAIFRALMDFMLEHERLVDNIFRSSMSGTMLLVFVDKAAEAIRSRHEVVSGNETREGVTAQMASEFAAGGLVRLVELWWEAGHPRDEEANLVRSAYQLLTRVFGD